MINLTNMWRACGGEARNKPYQWLRNADTQRLIETLEEKTGVANSRLTKVYRGGAKGTYAHGDLGIAYAQYLSPKFHLWCIEKIRETGLVEVSDGELLVRLGEDGLPVEQTNLPAEAQAQIDVLTKQVAVTADGGEYFSPRYVCEAIGVSWQGQYAKVKKHILLSKGVNIMLIPSVGGNQKTHMLPVEMLPGWLLSINPNRCKPEVRPALSKYHEEAFAVLDAWFRKGGRDEDSEMREDREEKAVS